MIVAIGLIGVFLSGFLLGVILRKPEQVTVYKSATAGQIMADLLGESADWVDDETVTGDVPPSWTGDPLR